MSTTARVCISKQHLNKATLQNSVNPGFSKSLEMLDAHALAYMSTTRVPKWNFRRCLQWYPDGNTLRVMHVVCPMVPNQILPLLNYLIKNIHRNAPLEIWHRIGRDRVGSPFGRAVRSN